MPLHGTSASTRSYALSSVNAKSHPPSRHSTRRQAAQALSQLRQPLRARLAGHDVRSGIALGENQRLATGSRAAIQNCVTPPVRGCNLRHQLRSLILQPHAALAKCRSLRYIARRQRACRGQQFSRVSGQFQPGASSSSSTGAYNANRDRRLALPMTTNRPRCLHIHRIRSSARPSRPDARCQFQFSTLVFSKLRARQRPPCAAPHSPSPKQSDARPASRVRRSHQSQHAPEFDPDAAAEMRRGASAIRTSAIELAHLAVSSSSRIWLVQPRSASAARPAPAPSRGYGQLRKSVDRFAAQQIVRVRMLSQWQENRKQPCAPGKPQPSLSTQPHAGSRMHPARETPRPPCASFLPSAIQVSSSHVFCAHATSIRCCSPRIAPGSAWLGTCEVACLPRPPCDAQSAFCRRAP